MGNLFKKDRNRVRIINWHWYVIMVEKGTRNGICHAIYRYSKAKNNYMRTYDKNKELSYLMYLDTSNSYGWAMSQKLPVNGFK